MIPDNNVITPPIFADITKLDRKPRNQGYLPLTEGMLYGSGHFAHSPTLTVQDCHASEGSMSLVVVLGRRLPHLLTRLLL